MKSKEYLEKNHKIFYKSPIGYLVLDTDGKYLNRLDFCENVDSNFANQEKDINISQIDIFTQTTKWLDAYFSGKEPDFEVPVKFIGGTEFQNEVWNMLIKIPYGQTITYGDIASEIAKRRGIKRMSAQAVGQAVGKNPISIIVPCHRVMGANNKLTGYASGVDKKIKLLEIEKINFNK